MRPNQASRLLVLSLLLTGVLSVAGAQSVEKPAALVADGIPEVPTELAARTRPYMEFRTATFLGWHPTDRSMLIATRFGNTNQVHRVAKPGGARTQLSFEEDRVQIASHAPRTGDVTLVAKDVGGGEFYQLYTLANGRLSLLTDGKSRNQPGAWSKDGQFVGYSSTRRNGKDTDLYVMNPRDPKSDRLVAERKGGGWTLAEFSPDRSRAVVIEHVSVTHSNLWLRRPRLRRHDADRRPLEDHRLRQRLGSRRTGRSGSLPTKARTSGASARSTRRAVGSHRAVPRRTGTSRCSTSPTTAASSPTSSTRPVAARSSCWTRRTARCARYPCRPAVIGGLEVAPWGEVGFTFTSARSPADAFSVDPATLAVTRWTTSETGGLDPNINVEPELVEVKSFDGLAISGFLYRPDPAAVRQAGGP